ncbi:carbon-nitrogen hydrolase family protein [Paenibacillus solisilvae]|uniref:Carbon-nitrogen hydrolase family protein n=1 Tax=Paenibacillus solisilvae TaxID=2486751 RepID=A0ABW0W3Z9_9BACL
MKLRIAGAQICVNDDNMNENLKTIHRAIDYAASENADILLTPEGALSGYTNRFNPKEIKEALKDVTNRAKVMKIGLALGTCYYEDDGLCYNQIRFYDKQGQFLGFHSKTLNCGTMDDTPKGEIEYFTVAPLKVFSFEGLEIGGLICNDMWANPECSPMPDPHLSQQLAKMGAKIIFHAVNGGRNNDEFSQFVIRNYHESNLRMRARAGKVWIVTVDNAFPVTMPNSCSGGVISPDGNWTIRLPEQGEHFFAHTIEF